MNALRDWSEICVMAEGECWFGAFTFGGSRIRWVITDAGVEFLEVRV